MLGDGDGKCSSGHDTTSLLLTAPRPAVRALDREADPPPRDAAVPGGAIRHIAAQIVREIREQFGSAAGNREVMTEHAPAFARWRPAFLPTCSCDPGRAILCSLSLPLRPLQWP